MEYRSIAMTVRRLSDARIAKFKIVRTTTEAFPLPLPLFLALTALAAPQHPQRPLSSLDVYRRVVRPPEAELHRQSGLTPAPSSGFSREQASLKCSKL